MQLDRQAGSNLPARAGASRMDWGIGGYESLAAQLLPAARVVVESARLRPDERVLDLGCGTGNAALLAAEQCGEVTGVDPATRLLEIARAQAASEGKNVTFLPGDAASFPVGDSAMPFAWEQREALLSLLGSRGFSVEVTHHALAFTGSSAREFLDDQARNHPMAVAGLSVLEQLGQAEALRARLLAILENGNEDAGKFRVTSRYVIATARRQR